MRFAFAIALAAALPALAHAEAGAVDWEKKVLKCTGAGAANLRAAQGNPAVARIGAERAAKLDAVRNCMEAIKGVTLQQGQTVGNALDADKALAGRVQGLVKGYKVVDKRYFEDGGVELDVEVPMAGVLSDALLPKGETKAAPAAGEPAGTCLVVDARGRKVTKAMAPRVIDESGAEIYGPSMLNEAARKLGGGALYAKSLEAAKKEQAARIGEKPVTVRAVGVDGADVVISVADAAALKGKNLGFLAEGRVLILTD
ncbi:MAG TPA: hypothetical protein VLT47_09340 [Anaeromyxobacteraceae bacterium]|nr:hypothetical protein [Anaeromyxobacteraceae bacterium]